MQIEYGIGPPGDDTLTHGLTIVASGAEDDDLFFVDAEAHNQAAKNGMVVKARKINDGEVVWLKDRDDDEETYSSPAISRVRRIGPSAPNTASTPSPKSPDPGH